MLQRQKAGGDKPLGETDPLGIGMYGARDDQADVQAVLNGFEPPIHEQLADLQPAIVRMDGETAELSDEIGMGPEVEEHGGCADHPAAIGLFGDEDQHVVGEDGALQPEFVVHFVMGIVGAVDREKDLADLADIFFAGFSNPNHTSPVRMIRNGRSDRASVGRRSWQ